MTPSDADGGIWFARHADEQPALVPLGAARVALLAATGEPIASEKVLSEPEPNDTLNPYEASRDIEHSVGTADRGLDDAQMHTTRMAILFSKRSNVEKAANEALLAYRRWHEVIDNDTPLDLTLKTYAEALVALRRAAQQAERVFKDLAADAVQKSVRLGRRR